MPRLLLGAFGRSTHAENQQFSKTGCPASHRYMYKRFVAHSTARVYLGNPFADGLPVFFHHFQKTIMQLREKCHCPFSQKENLAFHRRAIEDNLASMLVCHSINDSIAISVWRARRPQLQMECVIVARQLKIFS